MVKSKICRWERVKKKNIMSYKNKNNDDHNNSNRSNIIYNKSSSDDDDDDDDDDNKNSNNDNNDNRDDSVFPRVFNSSTSLPKSCICFSLAKNTAPLPEE